MATGDETRPHPAAALFPLMEGAELRALADDIRAHGLHQPIVVHDGLILDGRNRLRACEMAGVAPRFENWAGAGSPIEWVVSQNLHRRHLDASQRAMVGAGLVALFAEEAKGRMVAGRADPTANLREGERAPTAAAKAAIAINVSPRSVETAQKVMREAPPTVIEAVKRGEVAVSAAAKNLRPVKLPTRKTSRGPRSVPTYSILLVMPTNQASEVMKALRGLGFEKGPSRGSHDAEMRMPNSARKEKSA